MNINTAIKKINAAIHKRKVLELIYQPDESFLMFFEVVPVCINEHDGKMYLLAWDQSESAYAFEIERITAIDEYLATFSFSIEFDIDSFKDCLFNKGKNINEYIFKDCSFNRYIMVKNNFNSEKLRKELQAIESDIKVIVGPRKEGTWMEVPADIDLENLKDLLRSRRYCLNMLFRKDPKGLEHFRKANNLLRSLTDRMYKKGARVYRQYLISGIDETFDDDFMIDADLRFVYNDGESIAKLDDEEYYGSDFDYMMNVIYDLCTNAPCGASFSKGFRKSDKPEMSDKELELDNDMDRFCWGSLNFQYQNLRGWKYAMLLTKSAFIITGILFLIYYA